MSDIALIVVISIVNILFAAGSYLVWPSRWNIPAHLQLGFCIPAFVLPLFDMQGLGNVSHSAVMSCVRIQALAAPFYIVGLLAGAHFAHKGPLKSERRLEAVPEEILAKSVSSKISIVMFVCILGMLAGYWVMGFVPMFADDPLAAKFFRGEYQAGYMKAAIPFRLCFFTLMACVPVAAIAGVQLRSWRLLGLCAFGVALMLSTLARQPAVSGTVLALGLLAAYSRRLFWPYFAVLMILPVVGCVSYYVLGEVFDIAEYAAHYHTDSMLSTIVSGSPDLYDQLAFLEMFDSIGEWTYGETFVGALVPFRNPMNPDVWAVTIINGGGIDIDNSSCGGLRLPPSIWGYTAFGYWGAALVPFFSGAIMGFFTIVMARNVGPRSLIRSILYISLFLSVGALFSQFYRITYYAFPPCAIILWLFRTPRFQLAGQRTVPAKRPMDLGPATRLRTGPIDTLEAQLANSRRPLPVDA